MFTIFTFLTIGISFILFIIDKGLEIGVGVACAVAKIEGDETYNRFEQWYLANS